MKLETIKPKFVDFIPDLVEDGVLYISIQYGTAAHKCACGCGELVVTPIKPLDWKITWNGESITMFPSIGNWSFQCQSHYFIEESRVIWARKMSQSAINEGRLKDQARKDQYYKKFQKKRE